MTWATIIALVVAFSGGLGFACFIARWPFPAGLTWLAVVLGCGFTNGVMSVLLWELSHDWRVALLVPWGCYILTGLPMIVGQVIKDNVQFHEAATFHEQECWKHD